MPPRVAITWPRGAWATEQDNALPGLEGATAIFSQDRVYRYALTRSWGPGPWVCWLMLNPSTADAFKLDPTITRCLGFTRDWAAYGGLVVVNLFAFRSTNPAGLGKVNDPVGPANDDFIMAAVLASGLTVAAWGAPGCRDHRDVDVREKLLGAHRLYCLGLTAKGQPKHPLMLRASTELRPYPAQAAA